MKKIIFVLPLMAMMIVGCSNPTNTTIPVVIPPVVPVCKFHSLRATCTVF